MDAEQLTKELSLKALSAITTLVSDYKRGLITKGQVSSGCRAVFDTVSGLVGTEVINLVSQAAAEFKSKGFEVEIIKHADGTLRGALRVCGKGKVLRIRAEPHFAAPYNVDEPDMSARRVMDRYMEDLHR